MPQTATLFLLSLFALLLAPLLFEGARRMRSLVPLLSGFVTASLGGLALFGLLPEAVEQAGGWALLVAAAGLLVFTLVERLPGFTTRRVHAVAIGLALSGLLLHMVLDGVAVSVGQEQLGLAVVLHRVPFALGLWWMVRPRYGVARAAIALLLAGGATLVGFLVGPDVVGDLSGPGTALFSAFITGAILHVLGHTHVDEPAHADGTGPGQWRGLQVAEVLGFGVGVGVLALLAHPEREAPTTVVAYADRFLGLSLEAAPALVLGYALAGLVAVLLPSASLGWLQGGGALGQAARGTLVGIPLPVCSCGVVPLYQSLVRRGAPAAAALAFLVATPELGIEAVLLSVPLLGLELTVARLVAAVLVALAVGTLVGRLVTPGAPGGAVAASSTTSTGRPALAKLRESLRVGFSEVFGETAAWIMAGLALAAAVDTSTLMGFASGLPPGVDLVLAALLGVPLYVCASGATPLAAALIAVGLSPGAALTFLLAGPATNVTTLGTLGHLHGRRVAAAFAGAVVGTSILCGLGTNLLLSSLGATPPPLVVEESHSMVAWASLGVLSVALGVALLRVGPVGLLSPLLHLGGQHEHDDHDHDHHHDHDHDHDHPDRGHDHGHAHDDHGHGHGHDHDHVHDHDHGQGPGDPQPRGPGHEAGPDPGADAGAPPPVEPAAAKACCSTPGCSVRDPFDAERA